ncbi:MAG TPA: PIG-L family deacetylase, partial [Victivallales bacterium]|nr:PIG-L family deacetylase [Victivallales bacterium]
MKKVVMAIGAHADDIEIQAGGTLLKYRDAGYEVVYVMSTNNMSGGVSEIMPDGQRKTTKETTIPMMNRRKKECEKAAGILGTEPIHLDHPQRHYWNGSETVELRYGCSLPEGVPPNVPSIMTAYEDKVSVDALADLILKKNPECILTHPVAQVNVEHFSTCILATRAYWKAVAAGFKGGMLHWREHHTEFGDFYCRWETFVDYTPYLEKKMELIGAHRCQMPGYYLPDFGHRVLALKWGTACGCGAAEAFTWVRRSEMG